jgi:hypothetical protein
LPCHGLGTNYPVSGCAESFDDWCRLT